MFSKWVINKILVNPVFIELVITVVMAVMDKKITKAERETIKRKVTDLITDALAKQD